ncbi:protein phosphatase 2C domain-containing protein [Patescibacteria group bacterium]
MIQLQTDHYFHIGKAHLTGGKPCQDYAISQVYNQAAFAITCDGCSSGRHTDVGARILALATANALKQHWQTIGSTQPQQAIPEIILNQRIRLASAQQLLGLQQNDMLATCLYAYLGPLGGFIHIQGDGVVALKFANQSIQMYSYEWSDNRPFYPAYANGQLSTFIASHGNNLQALRLTEEVWQYTPERGIINLSFGQHSLSQGLKGITIEIPNPEFLLAPRLEYIAVFSDGITQIDNVDWQEAVVEFLNFKNTKGEFAKRRMIRGIKNMQKEHKGPLDDIAYAVIRLEQTGKEENNAS